MAITKLTAELSNVSALSDYPNTNDGLSSTELKETFDKAGNDIKDYINETLTEEVDSGFVEAQENLDTYKQEVVETYATKDDIAQLIIGEIPPGTLREEQFQQDVQDKIDSSYEATQGLEDTLQALKDDIQENQIEPLEDKIKPIEKYNELGNPHIMKDENGVYTNNWTLDFIPSTIPEGYILNVKTPQSDPYQDGSHYYTHEGWKIEGGTDVLNIFDDDTTTSATVSDNSVIIELPTATDITSIKQYITGATSVTYKGSNDKTSWNTCLIIAADDSELTEHTFLAHSAYKYYKVEIVGTATIYEIEIGENPKGDEWYLGTGVGMLSGIKATINNINVDELLLNDLYYQLILSIENDEKLFIQSELTTPTKIGEKVISSGTLISSETATANYYSLYDSNNKEIPNAFSNVKLNTNVTFTSDSGITKSYLKIFFGIPLKLNYFSIPLSYGSSLYTSYYSVKFYYEDNTIVTYTPSISSRTLLTFDENSPYLQKKILFIFINQSSANKASDSNTGKVIVKVANDEVIPSYKVYINPDSQITVKKPVEDTFYLNGKLFYIYKDTTIQLRKSVRGKLNFNNETILVSQSNAAGDSCFHQYDFDKYSGSFISSTGVSTYKYYQQSDSTFRVGNIGIFDKQNYNQSDYTYYFESTATLLKYEEDL